ncbi:hypothetical protein [Desulfuribacillus stibiiarsenatis]|uniref:hypothetical protein n=1 Tax=Desulfuribacillus stibiiarsenatis TaxID=1390249 RepID=UPI0015B52748|nr:hypothetical protein [Desulfuribacillus stibiiarsenatis]
MAAKAYTSVYRIKCMPSFIYTIRKYQLLNVDSISATKALSSPKLGECQVVKSSIWKEKYIETT